MSTVGEILIAIAFMVIIIGSTSVIVFSNVLDYLDKYLMRFMTNEHMLLHLLKDMDRKDLLEFHEKAMKTIKEVTGEDKEDTNVNH